MKALKSKQRSTTNSWLNGIDYLFSTSTHGIWLPWLQSLWHQEEALENVMDTIGNKSNESIEEWAEIDDKQLAEWHWLFLQHKYTWHLATHHGRACGTKKRLLKIKWIGSKITWMKALNESIEEQAEINDKQLAEWHWLFVQHKYTQHLATVTAEPVAPRKGSWI